MKVAELMTRNVQSCTPETNLAAAAMQMWDGDFGTLPVMDDEGNLIGMITDRDICMAAATRHEDIANIKVGDVITRQVESCSPEMSLRDALHIFENARVRRLPVVNRDERLEGILSLTDIVRYASDVRDQKSFGISHTDVVSSLKAVCAPHAKATAARV